MNCKFHFRASACIAILFFALNSCAPQKKAPQAPITSPSYSSPGKPLDATGENSRLQPKSAGQIKLASLEQFPTLTTSTPTPRSSDTSRLVVVDQKQIPSLKQDLPPSSTEAALRTPETVQSSVDRSEPKIEIINTQTQVQQLKSPIDPLPRRQDPFRDWEKTKKGETVSEQSLAENDPRARASLGTGKLATESTESDFTDGEERNIPLLMIFVAFAFIFAAGASYLYKRSYER